MSERFVPMDKITPQTQDWKCMLRVMKKYGEQRARGTGSRYQKFIFGDELGNLVDAITFVENVDTFGEVLREVYSYVVKGAIVDEQKMFKSAIATSAYQWKLRRDTSIMEELTSTLPQCELKIDTITATNSTYMLQVARS